MEPKPNKKAPTKRAKKKRVPKGSLVKQKKESLKQRTDTMTQSICDHILLELCKGTPLTLICLPSTMPSPSTVYNWLHKYPEFAEQYHYARMTGFDQLAYEAIQIADCSDNDTILSPTGEEKFNREWVQRSKLRVETRLKLLSKWDPQRYGDKITTEHVGPGGGPIKTLQAHEVDPSLEDKILKNVTKAYEVAATVMPPAVFKGVTHEA